MKDNIGMIDILIISNVSLSSSTSEMVRYLYNATEHAFTFGNLSFIPEFNCNIEWIMIHIMVNGNAKIDNRIRVNNSNHGLHLQQNMRRNVINNKQQIAISERISKTKIESVELKKKFKKVTILWYCYNFFHKH